MYTTAMAHTSKIVIFRNVGYCWLIGWLVKSSGSCSESYARCTIVSCNDDCVGELDEDNVLIDMIIKK